MFRDLAVTHSFNTIEQVDFPAAFGKTADRGSDTRKLLSVLSPLFRTWHFVPNAMDLEFHIGKGCLMEGGLPAPRIVERVERDSVQQRLQGFDWGVAIACQFIEALLRDVLGIIQGNPASTQKADQHRALLAQKSLEEGRADVGV